MYERSEKPDIQTLLFRARLQLEEENTEQALQVLKELSAQNQQHQEIQYLKGWASVQLKDWEQAITMLAPILGRAEDELKNEQSELTDREQLAHYLLQLGIAAINLEHYQDATLHLKFCLKVLHDRRVHLPKVRIQARYSLAMACMMRGLLEPALQYYEEAERLCTYYQRDDELGNIYYGLAETYRYKKDLVTAYTFAQKALEQYRQHNKRMLESRVQTSLGRISHLLGNYPEAAKHYTESTHLASLAEPANKSLLEMLNCVALADLYVAEGDLETARRYSGWAREYIDRLERQVLLDGPYQISGKVAYEESKRATGAQREALLNEAMIWYEKAIGYMKNIQAQAGLAELYADYAYVLEDLGRHKEALAYWRNGYESLKDAKDGSL